MIRQFSRNMSIITECQDHSHDGNAAATFATVFASDYNLKVSTIPDFDSIIVTI